MEPTNHHILEAVSLNLGPVIDLIGRDILRIAGDIIRGVGISALGTNGCHQFIVFVGNKILSSNLRDRVDLMISLLTRLRVCQLAISLITLFYLCQQRSLCLRVVRTKLLSALEHQVLQIMRQTSGLCGVVLRARTYCDVSLDTWFL